MRFSLGIVNAVALEVLIVCSLVPDSKCTTVSSGSLINSNTRDGRDAGNQLNRDSDQVCDEDWDQGLNDWAGQAANRGDDRLRSFHPNLGVRGCHAP